MGISLIWTFISSKLGIIVIAALALGAFGFYHKIIVWGEQKKIESITKERDKAIQDLYNERQKVADLEKKIEFQRGQLSLGKRIVKETTDVKQAVGGNDRDYLYNNWLRLYDYKNPTTPSKSPSSNIKRLDTKAKAKTTQ